MIVNSKFSSLYLGKKGNWKAQFDQDVCYMQKFAIDEEIRIQFVGYTDVFFAEYTDGKNDVQLDIQLLHQEGDKRIFEVVFSIDKEGVYMFHLTDDDIEAYSYFHVKKEDELQNTVLISYTQEINDFDTIFIDEEGIQKTFNFRIEGGFYPGDKTQAVENEIFRDQRFAPYQLSADTYEVSVLTIGTKKGVPQWVGNKINNIFKLPDVLVNGISTTRSESSIPELIKVSDYYPLYVFKLSIEQSDIEVINEGYSRIFDIQFDNTFN